MIARPSLRLRPPLLLLTLVALAAVDAGPALPLDVGIEPAAALPFVLPATSPQLAIRFAAPPPDAIAGRLHIVVRDWRGAVDLELDRDLAIPAGGAVAVPLDLASSALGLRTVAYRLDTAAGRCTGSRACILGLPTGAGRDDAGFRYGVHLGRTPDVRRGIDLLGLIGVGELRVDASWLRREPEPGRWDWDKLDQVMAACAANAIEPQMLLAYGNTYAAEPTPEQAQRHAGLLRTSRGQAEWLYVRVPQADVPWRRFVRACVERYHDQVRLWEVWNEPDLRGFFLGSTDDYLRMLRSASAEIRAADPTALVMTGGFATTYQPVDKINVGLHERVLTEAADAFDIHAFHGHGPFSQFHATVDGELSQLRAKLPQPRPLYFDETALTATRYGEPAQACALVEKLAFARARGAIGYTWYDLVNDGTDPADDEQNYGLLTHDYQPKAVYAAYNQLIRRLRGHRYAGAMTLPTGRWGFAFANADERVGVLWREDPASADEPVLLRAEAGQSLDLMGNAAPLPVAEGWALAEVAGTPAYVVLPGGGAGIAVGGTPMHIESCTAVSGGMAHCVVSAVNPLPRTIDITYTVTGDTGEVAGRRLALAPGGRGSIDVDLPCPASATFAKPFHLNVAFAVAGTPWQGAYAVPCRTIQVIPQGDSGARDPDFTLAGYAWVVNYFEADPSNQALTWHGPTDLSARIWLGHDDAGLRVHVQVADDVHAQAGDAASAWEGDGLQIGFRVPGQTGFWELGAALANDGRTLRSLWAKPAGADASAADFSAACTPADGGMVYDVAIPYQAFGLSRAILEGDGLAFNLIVNDNDGSYRKGFVRIAPGLGESKDPGRFPVVRFAP